MLQDNTDNSIVGSTGDGPDEGAANPPKRRHRAASRPAGAPAASAAGSNGPAVTIVAAGSGGSVISSEAEASDLPRPPTGRRRRATRSASAPVEKLLRRRLPRSRHPLRRPREALGREDADPPAPRHPRQPAGR
jgi:ribonuclease E